MRTLFLLLISLPVFAQVSPSIRINQEGYYASGPKTAIVAANTSETRFYIIGENNDTAFSGTISPPVKSTNSSLVCRAMDFSALKTNGRYRLSIPGTGSSYPFIIGTHALHSSSVSALKGYYFQRVSMPLESRYAGRWSRPAGHPDDKVEVHPSAATAKRPAGTIISSPGGWYDAGDYNKYIVNSGITMGTLLAAYEDFGERFDTLQVNIPESGNKLPDILDETLYNLRWMLTMQDPNDGGVYHKCTNAAFDSMVMPGVTKLPRYVVAKSTAAALDFAAVMAQASRVMKKFEKQLPGLADSCRNAALSAWQWAIANPAAIYRQEEMNKQFQPAVSTGAYGDGNVSDEWFWAACELLVSTSDKTFAIWIIDKFANQYRLVSWNQVGMAGIFTLLRHEKSLPRNMLNQVNDMKAMLTAFADSLLANAAVNAFRTVMGGSPKDFEWGSNAVAANQAIALVNAFMLTRDPKYLHGAVSNADYIMGRNATGYCFLTGAGSKYPMRPHHRPSVADGIEEPVPGLLAGGPNPARQDGCKYEYTEPETCFVDDDCSYASNEIAINWNAPLVYLLNAIDHLFNSQTPPGR
jgi:endoglucanase